MYVERTEANVDNADPPTGRTMPEPHPASGQPPVASHKSTATSYLTGLLFGSSTGHKIAPVESPLPPVVSAASAMTRRLSTTMTNMTSNLRRKSIAITV